MKKQSDARRINSKSDSTPAIQLYARLRLAVQVLLTATSLLSFTSPSAATTPGGPETIAEGLKSPAFREAYRRAFAPYLGLSWVSRPVLEGTARSVTLPEGRQLRVFVACRPHACARNRLSFTFEPASRKGWGLISIQSDVLGDASGNAVEEVLAKALEGQ